MDEIVIGISGINAVDNPGPGIGVARALRDDKELNLKIIGLAYDAMEPGAYMDWLLDRTFMMPFPSGETDHFLERLGYIKESAGLDVIIPNLDTELPLYIKYRREIEALGIKLFLPEEKQYRLRGKDRLGEIAEKMSLELPETKIAGSLEEFVSAAGKFGFPMMVKGVFYKAYIAYNLAQAASHCQTIAAEWGYPILMQKTVKGEELNVVGVGDGEGGCLGLVGIKKLWITSLGKIWTGVTIRNKGMLQAAADFVREVKWKGPFELECIASGDTIYLIEINPRFPAWVYFSAGVGVNLPANLVRKALGRPLFKLPDYEAGKMFVRYTYEIITDMKVFQNLVTRGEN